MPKKVDLYDLKLSKRPRIETITHNGSPFYYWYIIGAEDERYRVSSNYKDKSVAKEQARVWEEKLDPKVRAEEGNVRRRLTPLELFDLKIGEKKNKQNRAKLKTHWKVSPSVKKFVTLKKAFEQFLNEFHARPEAERLIDVGTPIKQIKYADQITTYWLEHQWRPTWFVKKGADGEVVKNGGSVNSIQRRLEMVTELWHYAMKTGYLKNNYSSRNCACTACNMGQMDELTKTVKPTPPFELWQYQMVVDACSRYEEAYDKSFGTEGLRITGARLRCFIEVMRNCGPRILDATLMHRNALRLLPNGKARWMYVPVKNGNENHPLDVPIPRRLYDALMALPQHDGIDPEHFFFSGLADYEHATKPWGNALRRLFAICPKEATTIVDKRNHQKVRPSSHMFRDTFCVQCRLGSWRKPGDKLDGMTYAQIADAIGDTEQMVRNHYSPYCKAYDDMLAEGIEVSQGIERMQDADAVPFEVLDVKGAHVVGQANA